MSTYYPDLTGTILLWKEKFWKITGPAYKFGYSWSYPVIKCSKTGKEYRVTNGFDADYVLASLEESRVGYSPPAKAAITEGIESAKRKRRIAHLERRIAHDTRELERLKAIDAGSC